MKRSTTRQLVWKDLEIMKRPVLGWWAAGVVSIVVAILGPPGIAMACMIFFITAMAGAGIHAVMQTVVEERREQTLAFVMSLPITVREYTSAKLIANLAIFVSVWLTLSAASFVVFIGDQGLPDGTIPFVTIVLVGIFLAYVIILATSLITESIGYSVASIILANLATQIFLWWVADLHGIRSVVNGSSAVWNATALTVLVAQILVIALLIVVTYALQARKRDFI